MQLPKQPLLLISLLTKKNTNPAHNADAETVKRSALADVRVKQNDNNMIKILFSFVLLAVVVLLLASFWSETVTCGKTTLQVFQTGLLVYILWLVREIYRK